MVPVIVRLSAVLSKYIGLKFRLKQYTETWSKVNRWKTLLWQFFSLKTQMHVNMTAGQECPRKAIPIFPKKSQSSEGRVCARGNEPTRWGEVGNYFNSVCSDQAYNLMSYLKRKLKVKKIIPRVFRVCH